MGQAHGLACTDHPSHQGNSGCSLLSNSSPELQNRERGGWEASELAWHRPGLRKGFQSHDQMVLSRQSL